MNGMKIVLKSCLCTVKIGIFTPEKINSHQFNQKYGKKKKKAITSASAWTHQYFLNLDLDVVQTFNCYPDGWSPDRVLKKSWKYIQFLVPIFGLIIVIIIYHQLAF